MEGSDSLNGEDLFGEWGEMDLFDASNPKEEGDLFPDFDTKQKKEQDNEQEEKRTEVFTAADGDCD